MPLSRRERKIFYICEFLLKINNKNCLCSAAVYRLSFYYMALSLSFFFNALSSLSRYIDIYRRAYSIFLSALSPPYVTSYIYRARGYNGCRWICFHCKREIQFLKHLIRLSSPRAPPELAFHIAIL